MKFQNPKVDLDYVERTTSFNKMRGEEHIKDTVLYLTDPNKKERQEAGECKICYYLSSKIGGSAMTETNCGICDIMFWNSSTCTDKLCAACAKKHKLCSHCAGDLEMKRRKSL